MAVQAWMQRLVQWQQQVSFNLTDLIWLLLLAAVIVLFSKVAVKLIRFLLVLAMIVLTLGFLFTSGLLPMTLLGA
ncbi:MAG: hypothetical protein PHD32_00875 [Eubacteriales bacterium]|nr:hypothetical protein [Eubacteriales bacterium]